MFKRNNDKKYMKLEDVRVFYDDNDGSLHLTSKDKNLPKGKGFHLTLNQGRPAENTLREMMIERGFIPEDGFKDLPEPLTLDYARPVSREWQVPLGQFSSHEEAIWDMDKDPELVILGHTGSGKSVVLRNILFHCFQHPDKFDIVSIDPFSSIEMKPYINMSPVMASKKVASSFDEIFTALSSCIIEMHKRYQEMEEENVYHFSKLSATPKRIVIIIDEVFSFAQKLEELTHSFLQEPNRYRSVALEIPGMINEIARLGRAAGIHLVLSSQRSDNTIIKQVMKNSSAACISMGRVDFTTAKNIIQDEKAFKINGSVRGRGYFKKHSQAGEFQSYYAPMDWFTRKEETTGDVQ